VASEDDFEGLFDDIDVNSTMLRPTVAKRKERVVTLLDVIGVRRSHDRRLRRRLRVSDDRQDRPARAHPSRPTRAVARRPYESPPVPTPPSRLRADQRSSQMRDRASRAARTEDYDLDPFDMLGTKIE
jgi:hypothetical protein